MRNSFTERVQGHDLTVLSYRLVSHLLEGSSVLLRVNFQLRRQRQHSLLQF